MSTTNLNVRVDEGLKKSAEELFACFGLSMSTAVNMFFKQAVRTQSIPFELKLYNTETELAMAEANDILSGKTKAKTYKNAEALFSELDSEDDNT